MAESISVGDRVRVLLDSDYWQNAGWVEGSVVRIEPYSEHRSFYWVQLEDDPLTPGGNTRLISVLNPKKIEKLQSPSIG